MAAKPTPIEQSLDNLQGIQVRLLRLTVNNELTHNVMLDINSEIGREISFIRSTLARVQRALTGHDTDA